jgi:DNA mismatch repair protein MutL
MQYRGQYIITAVQSGLMMVEQHRAHVRILYDRYMEQLERHQAGTQGLLFPELIQLSGAETAVMDESMDVLSGLGFELSPLGGGSYSLLGIPSGLDGADPNRLIHEILEEVSEGLHGTGTADGAASPQSEPSASGQLATIRHRAALTMARRTAIPVGQALSEDEMESLLSQLLRCRMPSVSPTGETILTILREEEVRKRF